MKRRLFMRLNVREIETLCRVRDDMPEATSFRTLIVAMCDSELVRRLCFITRTEVELRKISVNLRQIIRRLREAGCDCGRFESTASFLDSMIEIISEESSCIRMDDAVSSADRHEISIRMTAGEKKLVEGVKKVLRFRCYRALVMSLCRFAGERYMPEDISSEYEMLKEAGVVMNDVARSLNRGDHVDADAFLSFFRCFVQVLINLSMKVSGDTVNAV